MANTRPADVEADSTLAAMEPMAYFPHDANAASDSKCKRLIKRRGYSGYGRWLRLCELMAGEWGHHVPFATEEDVEMLADELRYGDDACRRFVLELADIGLIDAEELEQGGTIFSERMGRNALAVGRMRAGGRSRGR